jgi:hypothetical protein
LFSISAKTPDGSALQKARATRERPRRASANTLPGLCNTADLREAETDLVFARIFSLSSCGCSRKRAFVKTDGLTNILDHMEDSFSPQDRDWVRSTWLAICDREHA